MRKVASINSDRLLSGNITKLFLRYLFPSVCATLLIAVNYLIDTICVGMKIGEVGLAALNVVVPVTGLLYAVGYLFAFGSSNLFSNCMGEGDTKLAKRYYGTSVLCLAVFSVLIMVPGLIFNEQISRLLCAGAPFYSMTADYLRYVFIFAPFYCFETFYSVYMRNDGAPVFSMLGTFVTCSTNIVLDILLVWEFDLGMVGASLATGLALVLGFLVVFSATMRPKSKLKLWQSRIKLRLIKPIMVNGAPDFLREFSGSVVVLLVNVILLKLSGQTAVSAYGVIANLGNVVICGLAGVSNAVQPLVSYNIGAGQVKRAKGLLRLAQITSAVLAGAYVLFAELWPDLLVSAFLEEPTPALSMLCRDGIRVISPGYILAGISIVLNVYFEAVHAPREAFWAATIRGLLAPVVCIIACVLLWDLSGVWTSFLATEAISLLASVLLYRGVDKKIENGAPVFSEIQ